MNADYLNCLAIFQCVNLLSAWKLSVWNFSPSSPFLALFNSGVCTDREDLGTRTEFSFGGNPLPPFPPPLEWKAPLRSSITEAGLQTGEGFAAQKDKGCSSSFVGVEPSFWCFPFHSGLEHSTVAWMTPVHLCGETCWRCQHCAPASWLLKYFCLIFKSKESQGRVIDSFKVVTEGHWPLHSGKTEISSNS